jgi:Gas vesicle synthesis protein GvpL/GvpF
VGEPGRYLYAVTRGIDVGALDGVPALSGGSLEVLEHDGLQAVVSSVDLDEYGEEGLRANLERLDWLEVTARAHDAVVKAVADVAPVAPMRLATIFLDDTSLHQRLAEWYHALTVVLDRVDGRHEWSVKVIAPLELAEQAPVPSDAPVSGADYLRQKQLAAEQRATHATRSEEEAQEVHAALTEHAVASRILPPQDARLAGYEGTMFLNAAYLVEREEGAAFAREAAACAGAHEHLEIDVRGPWPPYSFAMLDQR